MRSAGCSSRHPSGSSKGAARPRTRRATSTASSCRSLRVPSPLAPPRSARVHRPVVSSSTNRRRRPAHVRSRRHRGSPRCERVSSPPTRSARACRRARRPRGSPVGRASTVSRASLARARASTPTACARSEAPRARFARRRFCFCSAKRPPRARPGMLRLRSFPAGVRARIPAAAVLAARARPRQAAPHRGRAGCGRRRASVRRKALREAAEFGMIGLIDTSDASDAGAPEGCADRFNDRQGLMEMGTDVLNNALEFGILLLDRSDADRKRHRRGPSGPGRRSPARASAMPPG